MAMVGLSEAHVAKSHISAIRSIRYGAVLELAKAETSLTIRRMK